jgi:mannitol-1-phosphate 5-dehydrogenase
VEPYKELPVDRRGFRGVAPKIAGMTAHDNFPVYTARKLYIHNCGHAVLAYAGHHAGYEYGWEAMADSEVNTLLRAAWEESAAGIAHTYGADIEWLREHMADLDKRFRNKALGDTLFRLGRDPIRKLGPTDRMVAPALLALDAGITPVALARAIALALAFDHPDDPVAVDLQAGIARHGAAAALADATELATDHPLSELVLEAYSEITGI